MKEHTYEKIYKLPRYLTAKDIITSMSCEELQRVLIEAKDQYGLEKILGFSRVSIYKYLRSKMKECFYTAQELADVLGIPYPTLVVHLRKGKYHAFKYSGKYLIPKWLLNSGE